MVGGEMRREDGHSSYFSNPFSEMFPMHGMGVKVEKLSNINWNKINVRRGGVIPYRIIDGIRYFNLGIHRESGQGTDFGGMINYKSDKNALNGALREFSEETIGIFGKLPKDLLNSSIVVYDIYMIIIFVNVTNLTDGISDEEFKNRFHKKISEAKHKKNLEMKSIIWIHENYLQWLVDFPSMQAENIIYEMVRDMLYRAGNFYQNLELT